MPMRKSRTVLLAPALVALALAACGSSDEAATDGTASPQASGQDAMVEFARCMREHGVDMPDPGSDGRVMIGPDDVDTGSQEFQDAQEACQGILDGAVQAADGGGVRLELPADPDDPDVRAANEACRDELPVPGGPDAPAGGTP